MSDYIYTKNILTGDGSMSAIQPNDVVMLNGSNVWLNIDDNISGLNPIPSFDIARGISSTTKLSIENAQEQIDSIQLSALSALSEISNAAADYAFTDGETLSVLTSLKQVNGKTVVEARPLTSADVNGLPEFVDGKVDTLKQYVINGYLPLSGGVVVGNLSIDRDHALSIEDSSRLVVGNQTLCSLLSAEISLSTSTAVEKLSIDLSNDFGFGYDVESNTISAHVAGRTHQFSANRFTEARMLESARVETIDGKPWLILEFKVDSPDLYNKVSVDLAQIAPMHYGANGIDVQYDSDRGKYCISADSTVCHLSDIEALDVGNSIAPGQILSSLKQENGLVSYGTAPILSSYVEGLSDYVEQALSNISVPLSTVYGEWHVNPPEAKDGSQLRVELSTTYESGTEKLWARLTTNGEAATDFKELYDPYCYVGFDENEAIYKTAVSRKQDCFIIGHNINQPIQPKIEFGMLSALDNPIFDDTTLNIDASLETTISAVATIRDVLKQLRASIEHLTTI